MAAFGSSATSPKSATTIIPSPRNGTLRRTSYAAVFCGQWHGLVATLYPPDKMKRPTSATCDGCHSVNFNIQNHTLTEWNVGFRERCHGPGSEHVARPTRTEYLPIRRARTMCARNDTCIQCHSQGRPQPINPIAGKYYDWPTGLSSRAQPCRLLAAGGTHPGGNDIHAFRRRHSVHKNRMQGNDFVQSVMYRRGVRCFDCHDARRHGELCAIATTRQSNLLELSQSRFSEWSAHRNARRAHPP